MSEVHKEVYKIPGEKNYLYLQQAGECGMDSTRSGYSPTASLLNKVMNLLDT